MRRGALDRDEAAQRTTVALTQLCRELPWQLAEIRRRHPRLTSDQEHLISQAGRLLAIASRLRDDLRRQLGYEPGRWSQRPLPTAADRESALRLLATVIPAGAIPGPRGLPGPDDLRVADWLPGQFAAWAHPPQSLREAVAQQAARYRARLGRGLAELRAFFDRPGTA